MSYHISFRYNHIKSNILLTTFFFSPPHSIENHAHNHEELENAAGPLGNVAMHSSHEAHHAGIYFVLCAPSPTPSSVKDCK